MKYCGEPVSSRSKYAPDGGRRCYLPAGHDGGHSEMPYLAHLATDAPTVARKIVRDATKTTGAAWKSEDAGPNRIDRWVMLRSDADLLTIGIDMTKFKPDVVRKLQEKAATYEECMAVAPKLTWLVYGMSGAPEPTTFVSEYLMALFGPATPGTTGCLVCREPLNFDLFKQARRGRAEIETAHANPRSHIPSNVGFAHRACNIAQGNKTLDEFYTWISDILTRVGRGVPAERTV